MQIEWLCVGYRVKTKETRHPGASSNKDIRRLGGIPKTMRSKDLASCRG